MRKPTVLLVSQTPSIIEAVQGVCDALSHPKFDLSPGVEEACAAVKRKEVALLLVHLPTVGEKGVTRLLWAVALARCSCATVVLTDTYREQQATVLLRAGAADYLELPADLARLTHLIHALTHRAPSGPGPDSGPVPVERRPDPEESDDGMGRLMEQVRRVAPQEITLLLTGETGTGKTRLARLVHELSPRRHEPFLVVDCGTLSANLI